jgi:hypothetical protein
LSEVWKTYWPIFERLEAEFCDLSFSVAFCDSHLVVHSARLADLLVRSCAECENVGKFLCIEKGLVPSSTAVADLNFPAVGDAIVSRLPRINTKELMIIWPYQSLTNTTITPFDSWHPSGCTNPAWFVAYNKTKHDRISNAARANLDNVMRALGGLFILNLWLREDDTTRDSDDVSLAQRRVNSYSRFFSPAKFLQPASGDGISTSGVVSTRLRNLEFRWK